MAPGHSCGFLNVIYFSAITNKSQFEEFQKQFNRYADIGYNQWSIKRKNRWKDLHAMTSYINSSENGERERYFSYFSLQSYKKLCSTEMQKHNFKDCKQCITFNEYYLKRSNRLTYQMPQAQTTPVNVLTPATPAKQGHHPAQGRQEYPSTPATTGCRMIPATPVKPSNPATPRNQPATPIHPATPATPVNPMVVVPPDPTVGRRNNSFELLTNVKTPTTPQECATFVKSVIQAANSVLTPTNLNFHNIYIQKHDKMANDQRRVTKSVKRDILKVERDTAVSKMKEKDFVALYSSPQSEREWDSQRRDSYGVYKKHQPKSHISPIDSYNYSEGDLIIKLTGTEDLSSLNYTALAKEVKLVNREGNTPLNSGQVSLK